MITTDQLCGIGDEAGYLLEDQIAAHRQLEWHRMELRSIEGKPLFTYPIKKINFLKNKLEEASIFVPVLASKIGDWSASISIPFARDIEELNRLIFIAKHLGSPFIRIMSYPNDKLDEKSWQHEVVRRISELAKRAFDNGVTLLHENCHGWAAADAERALYLVEKTDNKGFALLYDVGNPVVHGYDGLAYLSQVVKYVRHVHVKDAIAPSMNKENFTFPGEGEAHIKENISLLLNNNYTGSISIEPHLALIPHSNVQADKKILAMTYIEYGRRFTNLLSEYLKGDANECDNN
jgi:sugar phosphate isomerase/epimerase